MVLNSDCRIVADDVSLLPLAKVADEDLALLFGAKPHVAREDAEKGGIELKIDQQLKSEAYRIEAGDRAVVTGGSSKGVAWGLVTLLQAADMNNGQVIIQEMKITDQPYAPYRGLMVDLARQWHPIDAVKQAVVLCQWYKIGYSSSLTASLASERVPSVDLQNCSTHRAAYITFQYLLILSTFTDMAKS